MAEPVAWTPPGRFGSENSTIGWIVYPLPPSVSMRSSTPPLATAVASKPGVGLPPVRVTDGVVNPKPDSFTAMLLTTPSEIWAVALASAVGVTPGDEIETVGART